ncbi:MAG TPA: hypothetical protein VGG73_03505 [Vicinamibacterales bacterium]|jgi:hypothetical protein
MEKKPRGPAPTDSGTYTPARRPLAHSRSAIKRQDQIAADINEHVRKRVQKPEPKKTG